MTTTNKKQAVEVLEALCEGNFDKPGYPSYTDAHKALAALRDEAWEAEPTKNEIWPPDGAVWLAPVATDPPADPRLMQYAWGRSSLSTGQMAEAYQCIVSAAQECGQVYRLPVASPVPHHRSDEAGAEAVAWLRVDAATKSPRGVSLTMDRLIMAHASSDGDEYLPLYIKASSEVGRVETCCDRAYRDGYRTGKEHATHPAPQQPADKAGAVAFGKLSECPPELEAPQMTEAERAAKINEFKAKLARAEATDQPGAKVRGWWTRNC